MPPPPRSLLLLGLLSALSLLRAASLSEAVVCSLDDGVITVTANGQPFTAFYYGESAPKPYLHPLVAPGGARLTRLFPMETTEPGSHDHPHHRGLWMTHGKVNGLDFWSNEPEQRVGKQGLVRLRSVEPATNSHGACTVHAVFEWRDPAGAVLLVERRTMRFASADGARSIDFDVALTAARDAVFGDTKEGFFALRLRDELTETRGSGRMTNAEGLSGAKEVWGKRSAWVDYSGRLDGKPAGVAIFDHPANPRHPTWWHARDYGLFAANPFGERDFTGDKSRDGKLELASGKALRFRFRIVLHSAPFDAGATAKAYATWSAGK